MLTPSFSAEKRASINGYDVMLGVWMKMLLFAVAKIWSRKVLSGVGGTGGGESQKGLKLGFGW